MLRRRTHAPSPPSISRAAAILLLAVSVTTSGIEFFSSSSECDYDGSYSNSSNSSAASGSGKDWWPENLTANFTELCSGMIDVNSSEPIYSFPRNATDGNHTYSKATLFVPCT